MSSAGAPVPAPLSAPPPLAPATRKATGGSSNGGGGGGNGSSSSSGGGKKQRILWDSDSATRGGKTSIAVLLEWLTAPGNYARWRSGKSQFGETREALCSEIKAEMQLHGILHRENANIRTQISELERSYEVARAWMAKHGHASDALRAGSDDEPLGVAADGAGGSSDAAASSGPSPSRAAVETAVLRLCRYFHVLDPIMRQSGDDGAAGVRAKRPYAPRKRKEREPEEPPAPAATARASLAPADAPVKDGDAGGAHAPAALPLGALPVPDLSSLSMPIGSLPAMASPALFQPWSSPALLSGLEETKRLLVDAAREERDRKRRQITWDEERARLERERLRLDVEAARLRVAAERAVARRRMQDARVSAAEIDRVLAAAATDSSSTNNSNNGSR